MVIYTNDLFFLRDSGIFVESLKHTILSNPNQCSRMLLVIIVVLYYFFLTDKENNKSTLKRHIFIIITILSVIVITTLSRINILALFIFIFLAFNMKRITGIRLIRITYSVVATGSLFLLVIIFVPGLDQRFLDGIGKVHQFFASMHILDPTAISGRRVRMWISILNVFRENAVFGVGYSRIEVILRFYGSILLGGQNPGGIILVHGGLLKILIYGGLVSLSAFILLYMIMIINAYKMFIKSINLQNKNAAYCTLILLIILVPINLIADNLSLSLTWMSISFLIANIEIQK
jgi:hypothetical protein